MLVDDVEGEMGEGVGESRDADHAPDRDQLRPSREVSQRRDEQRQQDEPHRPVAAAMDQLGDRLGEQHARRRFEGNHTAGANRPAKTTALSGEKRPLRSFQGAFSFVIGFDLSCKSAGCATTIRARARVCFTRCKKGRR